MTDRLVEKVKSPKQVAKLLADTASVPSRHEDASTELVRLTGGLRGFYAADSRQALLLGELGSDLQAGVVRGEVVREAKAVLGEVDPGTSLHKIVSRVLARFEDAD
jgi:hypothetical protein